MPSFGFLLVIIGIFVLINIFNGNLIGLAMGDLQFNFTPMPKSTPSPTKTTPDTTRTVPTGPG